MLMGTRLLMCVFDGRVYILSTRRDSELQFLVSSAAFTEDQDVKTILEHPFPVLGGIEAYKSHRCRASQCKGWF